MYKRMLLASVLQCLPIVLLSSTSSVLVAVAVCPPVLLVLLSDTSDHKEAPPTRIYYVKMYMRFITHYCFISQCINILLLIFANHPVLIIKLKYTKGSFILP